MHKRATCTVTNLLPASCAGGSGRGADARPPKASTFLPGGAMPKRLCGTPGCTQADFHDGPCDGDAPTSKRQRIVVLAPEPKRTTTNNSGGERSPGRGRGRAAKVDASGLTGTATEVAAPRIPATQGTMPNGLQRFYHAHQWGVPLPSGQVEVDGGGSDEEVDDNWRLEEIARHTEARPEVAQSDRSLMSLWNAFVRSGPSMVSDRMLPEACRRFAQAHTETLRTDLRGAFRAHLRVLWEHNLLHQVDVQVRTLASAYPPSSAATRAPERKGGSPGLDRRSVPRHGEGGRTPQLARTTHPLAGLVQRGRRLLPATPLARRSHCRIASTRQRRGGRTKLLSCVRACARRTVSTSRRRRAKCAKSAYDHSMTVTALRLGVCAVLLCGRVVAPLQRTRWVAPPVWSCSLAGCGRPTCQGRCRMNKWTLRAETREKYLVRAPRGILLLRSIR